MSKESGTRHERSRAYPGHDLETVVGFVTLIRSAIGLGRSSRLDIANALGHESVSGPAGRKIGSLTHFGLLSVQQRAGYVVSRLAQRILTPTDDLEKEKALIEAFKNPTLFGELHNRYVGEKLPTLLSNILVREFGIVEKKAESVVGIFSASAKYAGLLDNDVLGHGQSTPGDQPTSEIAGELRTDDTSGTKPTSAVEVGSAIEESVPQGSELLEYAIPLSERRVGSLRIPLGVSESDLERIKNWIDLMRDVLTESSRDSLKTD